MGGIAERTEVGVVRGFDPHRAAGADEPMELLHRADHVGQVFDHVDGGDAIERAVAERVREAVEIGEDVGAARGIAVEAESARLLVNPAADVEDSQAVWAVSPHFSPAFYCGPRLGRVYVVALAQRARRTIQVRLRALSCARLVSAAHSG